MKNLEGQQVKTATMNGLDLKNIILMVLSLISAGVCIYLTAHWYDLHFPESIIDSSGICNLSSFFNCDSASLSAYSNIAGVPTSVFGILFSAFIFAGSALPSLRREAVNHILVIINAIGCLVLLMVSLFVLKSLCPMCTIYYAISFAILFIYFKNSELKHFYVDIVGAYALIAVVVGAIFFNSSLDKSKATESLAPSLLKQFYSLPNLGNPKKVSPYFLATTDKKFEDSPVRIVIFSDFECPHCQSFAKMLPILEHQFKGQIAVTYNFYPLSNRCNPNMQHEGHANACKAAKIAICLPQKFKEVHDYLFENQDKLSDEWLNSYARQEKVEECINNPATEATLKEIVAQASDFNIKSTPTFLLNGVKIEGVLPNNQLAILISDIIKKNK